METQTQQEPTDPVAEGAGSTAIAPTGGVTTPRSEAGPVTPDTAWVVLLKGQQHGEWHQQQEPLVAANRRAANAAAQVLAQGNAFVVTPARSWLPVHETVVQEPKSRLADFDPFAGA